MNGWNITTVNAAGTTAGDALVLDSGCPWQVFNVVTSDSPLYTSVQLPVTQTLGDLVEVCVGSTMPVAATVWLGSTVLNSSTTHFESIDPGKSRFYRFISGPRWNKYD